MCAIITSYIILYHILYAVYVYLCTKITQHTQDTHTYRRTRVCCVFICVNECVCVSDRACVVCVHKSTKKRRPGENDKPVLRHRGNAAARAKQGGNQGGIPERSSIIGAETLSEFIWGTAREISRCRPLQVPRPSPTGAFGVPLAIAGALHINAPAFGYTWTFHDTGRLEKMHQRFSLIVNDGLAECPRRSFIRRGHVAIECIILYRCYA